MGTQSPLKPTQQQRCKANPINTIRPTNAPHQSLARFNVIGTIFHHLSQLSALLAASKSTHIAYISSQLQIVIAIKPFNSEVWHSQCSSNL
jgi:hypothetical protein